MKIYTKNGDKGLTRTAMGTEVQKDDCLIEANGVIDELMSSMDKVIYGLGILPNEAGEIDMCMKIQDRLRYLGGEISGKKVDKPITEQDVLVLEEAIDALDIDVYEFVRFQQPIAMDIDESRVRARKVERVLTEYLRKENMTEDSYKYINRLSDYLFILALYIEEEFGG